MLKHKGLSSRKKDKKKRKRGGKGGKEIEQKMK
jgi:hypothetical protein